MLRRLLLLMTLAPVVALAAPPDQQLTIPAPPKTASHPATQPAPSQVTLQSSVPQQSTVASWVPPDASVCRMACANAAYVCRAGDQPDSCDGSWSMCVATCTAPNLDPGVSTAP